MASMTRSAGSTPPALVADAGDVEAAAGPPRLQRGDRDAALDVDARLLLGGAREHLLERGPPRGRGHQPLVARPRLAVGDRGGQARHQVEPQRPGALERVEHVGQLRGQHLAAARLDEVRLAELRHAGAGPFLPRARGVLGHGRGVALEHGDAMPVAGQHHRGGQAAWPGAEHDRLRQGNAPPFG